MASSEEDWEIVNRQIAAPVEDTPEFREALARCLNAEDELATAHKGTKLWKVRSFSKWYRRKYYVDGDNRFLMYELSKKQNCRSEPPSIAVSDILDVRRGWRTDTFNKFGSKVLSERRKMMRGITNMKWETGGQEVDDNGLVNEACCFSVVYGDNRSTLDLVADTPEVADVWVRALRYLVTVLRGLDEKKRFTMWLQSKFQEADVDKSGTLQFDEVLRLLLQLNVKMARHDALRIFNVSVTKKPVNPTLEKPSLDFEDFMMFYELLMCRPELEELYKKYACTEHDMTAEELQNFLKTEQSMPEVTLEECKSLIDAFEPSELKSRGRLSIHAFTYMMCSETFDCTKSEHQTVCQDMTQPLSSYYIASSHNTYLLGRQVAAESTIEGYVEALWWGCRCLEIDCWDGEDGEPIVTHGYALTSKLIFREVLKDAILPNAFAFSEYPLILSLENHCSPEQQKRLAFHLIDVFGDLLYLEPASPDMETLPSPEQLKRRILIKGRKAKPVHAAEAAAESESDEEGETHSPQHANALANGREEAADPESHNTSSSGDKGESKLAKVTDQTLSDLVNLCESVHFRGFQEEGKCYQMVSLAEGKANHLMQHSGGELIKFNSRRLSRTYPSGLRTDSTNYDPWPFWNAGCQLVALNYQSSGEPMFINDARFRDNGCCGYVLKPDFLRLPDFSKFAFNPTANSISQMPRLMERRRLLKIEIISGQHLPKPEGEGLSGVLNPYVKVKIIGHPMDQKKKQTHVIQNNGLNPRWNHTFKFVVNVPELAFISFIVKGEVPGSHHPIVGAFTAPITSLALGYRHVPMLDGKRRMMEPASLFIHTELVELESWGGPPAAEGRLRE